MITALLSCLKAEQKKALLEDSLTLNDDFEMVEKEAVVEMFGPKIDMACDSAFSPSKQLKNKALVAGRAAAELSITENKLKREREIVAL